VRRRPVVGGNSVTFVTHSGQDKPVLRRMQLAELAE
jgi:hypothetical protein